MGGSDSSPKIGAMSLVREGSGTAAPLAGFAQESLMKIHPWKPGAMINLAYHTQQWAFAGLK